MAEQKPYVVVEVPQAEHPQLVEACDATPAAHPLMKRAVGLAREPGQRRIFCPQARSI